MATGGVIENQISSGLSQFTGGANGLITSGNCLGAPATDAGIYAPNCTLYQRDSSTGYNTVIWLNTGTAAVPVWTKQAGPARTANIISGLGATRTLLATESGSTILFDRANGIVITLPAIVAGLSYTFLYSVSLTSGAYEVATNNESTDFMLGGVISQIAGATDGSTTPFLSIGNGTSHVEISSNKTTTGGLAGGWLRITAINATQWYVEGLLVGSGALATPFST